MFNRVTINTTEKIRLKFYNNSLVSVDVRCRLEEETVFDVQPEKVNVESFSNGYFWLSFTPKAIQVCFAPKPEGVVNEFLLQQYAASFEMSYEVPASQARKSVAIQITGDGYVPEIVLLQPIFDDISNAYRMQFNPILVDTSLKRLLSFENTGVISCKVILEVRGDSDDVFALVPNADTIPLLNMWKNHGSTLVSFFFFVCFNNNVL